MKDLADVAGVDTKDIEDGVKFPYYAVDSNNNAYEHIKELAPFVDLILIAITKTS